MIILILIAVPVLGYLHEAKAYTTVADTGTGVGILTCPTGEQHEASIALFGTTTPTRGGEFDINIQTSGTSGSGEVLKSGIFNYVKITDSGEFTLQGKEIRDDICGSLASGGSIPITITGQCPPPNVRITVEFRASNGQKADFPASPTCS